MFSYTMIVYIETCVVSGDDDIQACRFTGICRLKDYVCC